MDLHGDYPWKISEGQSIKFAFDAFNVFDVRQVNHTHWQWGMTPSFLRSVLAGEGFAVIEEFPGPDLPNPEWMMWGLTARRTFENEYHWSHVRPFPGLRRPTGEAQSQR